MTTTVGALGADDCRQRLASPAGLPVRMGPFVMCMHTRLRDVAASVHRLYGDYELVQDGGFHSFDVEVGRRFRWRFWRPPLVDFRVEGDAPFNPLPGDQGFPLLEWGMNWCVYAMCHQYLVLHAAVLERGGRALLMPAASGSGKSTLTAALCLSGWRLLSDELALIDPADGTVRPIPRPVSLKNASIDVISRFAPGLAFGSRVEETSKGVVAHFAAPTAAVKAAHQPALPGWVVLPRYAADAEARLTPMTRAAAVIALAENAFNYDVYGREGFDLLCGVAGRSACFEFEYARLEDAVALFDEMARTPGPAVGG